MLVRIKYYKARIQVSYYRTLIKRQLKRNSKRSRDSKERQVGTTTLFND